MADSVKFNPWHAPEMKNVVGWNGPRKKGKGPGKGKSKVGTGRRKGGKGGGS